MLERAPTTDVTIGAFTTTPLGDTVILVTFRTESRSPGIASRHAWRSSLWVHRDGRWRLRFHQATPTTMSEPGDTGGA
jgi:hypothetical protein